MQGLTLQLTPQYAPDGQAFGAQMAQYATQETIAAAIRQAVKLAGVAVLHVCDEEATNDINAVIGATAVASAIRARLG